MGEKRGGVRYVGTADKAAIQMVKVQSCQLLEAEFGTSIAFIAFT